MKVFIAEVVIASPPRVNCQVNLNLNETEAKEFLDLYGTFKGTFEERLNKFHTRGKNRHQWILQLMIKPENYFNLVKFQK